jgi:hypothetical protein
MSGDGGATNMAVVTGQPTQFRSCRVDVGE